MQRFWEIHHIQRQITWADIDTTSMMPMEVRSSVAPAEGGKNVAGASVLPE